MKYLDIEKLRDLKLEDFLAIKPYPYFNTEGVLTETGFQDLLENMPPLDMFEQKFGYERRAGQAPHDRYSLEYTPDMAVPRPWKEFIDELIPKYLGSYRFVKQLTLPEVQIFDMTQVYVDQYHNRQVD